MFISNAAPNIWATAFFIAKMVLIGVAGLDMVVFHFVGARDLAGKWENDSRLPLSALAGRRFCRSCCGFRWWLAGAGSALPSAARMSRMSNCIRILPGVAARALRRLRGLVTIA